MKPIKHAALDKLKDKLSFGLYSGTGASVSGHFKRRFGVRVAARLAIRLGDSLFLSVMEL